MHKVLYVNFFLSCFSEKVFSEKNLFFNFLKNIKNDLFEKKVDKGVDKLYMGHM